MSINLTENELYQEITICLEDGTKIGEVEVELKSKMLSRFEIFEPYQNKGYGTEIVKILNEKYGCNCLWVNADNERAMHVYNKCGYRLDKPTMYLMTRG